MSDANTTPFAWLDGLPVLVLGLGDSGLAMVRWCARHGARVRVWDSRDEAPHDGSIGAIDGVERLRGALDPALLAEVKLVLKSPGLAPHDARIAPLLAAAAERGTLRLGELGLFVRALADLAAPTDESAYTPKVLAITGTNGKTTVTAMTALLVERAGRRVAMAGNVGPTMLDTLTEALARPRDEWPDTWVLELSSFQLDGIQGFEPDAAVVLNVTQDHLDWHGSMDAYAAAKSRVYGTRATMVVNRDDAAVAAMVPVPVIPKGRKTPVDPPRAVVRFGLEAPRHAGDFGLVVENGMAWLVRALPGDDTPKRRRDGDDEEIHLQRLMPADALRVRGRHNAANALAALALATAIGCPLAPMLHGLREYRGEPHRVEPVGSVGGIEAYDDSKGTNVGATVAALEGLGADLHPGRIVVILGGDGKGQDFSPLAVPVARHVRAAALIGRDAAAVADAIAGCGVPMQTLPTLPEAVAWAYAQAREGDAVLLSPACASLDMFRHYGHRAEVFVEAVRALAVDRGEAV